MTVPHTGWIPLLFVSGMATRHQSHGCTQASRRPWGCERLLRDSHLSLTLKLQQLSPTSLHYHLLLGLRQSADQPFCLRGPGDSWVCISHTPRMSPNVSASFSVLDHILKGAFPWGQLFQLFWCWWELANEKQPGIVGTAELRGDVGSCDCRSRCSLALLLDSKLLLCPIPEKCTHHTSL